MLAGNLLQILADIVFPLFAIIGVGVLAARAFRLDEQTLSKLCFHLLLPPLIFVKVLESTMDLAELRAVVVATLLHLTLLLLVGRLLLGWGTWRQHWPMLGLAAAFYNCGNYGIPLVELAYPNGGVGVMAGILMTQNFVFFSLGIYLVEGHGRPLARMGADLFKVPVLYAIVAAVTLRLFHLELPPRLLHPLHYLAGGLVPVALMTLGFQLARTRLAHNLAPLVLVSVVRLGLSPLIALGVALLVGLQPPIASIFVVAAGLPVAVNVYILAAEYRLDSGLASQAIFWTTLASACTIAVLLALLG